MIRLIFKELGKHKTGFFLLLLFWAASGYYIYKYKSHIPVFLSRTFLSLPDEGRQDPEKAYSDYILPAEKFVARESFWCSHLPPWAGGCTEEERSGKIIQLDLMEKSCRKYSGILKKNSEPHWLESIQEWNLSEKQKSERVFLTVDPKDYWDENNDTVLSALEKLLQASNYAWEIPPEVREDGKKETLLVAEHIARYAKAVCRDDMGLIAWGDYMEFQELRAGIEAGGKNPDFLRTYKYPSEKTLYSLKTLKNNSSYLKALREYSAGSAPESLLFACRNAPLSLPCASPDEAIRVLNKMIYFAPNEDLPGIYLKLAKLHFIHPDPARKKKTLDYLESARRSPGLKMDALILRIRYDLSENNLKNAYAHLGELKTALGDGVRLNPDYRRLARALLMKDGKFKEADCFSEKAETVLGVRDHCKNINL